MQQTVYYSEPYSHHLLMFGIVFIWTSVSYYNVYVFLLLSCVLCSGFTILYADDMFPYMLTKFMCVRVHVCSTQTLLEQNIKLSSPQ